MGGYILRRVLAIVPTLLITSLILFAVLRMIPGDAVDVLMAQMPDIGDAAKTRALLEAQLGLDRPFFERYLAWLGDILRGDLGTSIRYNTPVLDEILYRLPLTLELGLWTLFYALLIALPIGIWSAVRQDGLLDNLARSFAIVLVSVPGFVLGVLVLLLPAMWWGWSPPRYVPFAESPRDNFLAMSIPALIAAAATTAAIVRVLRTSMLEVMRQDYIRTAWAKGVSERAVVLRHAVKNAMIPVLTLIPILLPALLGGIFVLELIFTLPGTGILLLDAVRQRDYPVITGVFVVFAVLVVFVNLLIDLCYGWLDPRIRYDR